MLGIYLLLILGLLYTTNLKTGFFALEKKICFLLIPLFVLPLVHKFRDDTNTLFKGLGFVTLLSSAVLLLIACYKWFILHDPQAFFYGRDLSEGFTSIHYPYYSMYFACGSFMLMDSLFDELIKKRYGLLQIVLLFGYFLGIMILVASKTGIIVFALVSVLFLYTRLPDKKKLIIAIFLFFVLASIFLYFMDATRNRFLGLDEHLSVLTQDVLVGEITATGLNMRLLFWKITLLHLWQDNFVLTGVGTGDAQDYIDSLYNLPQYELWGYLGWDSHNQWIYILVQVGLAGILLLGLLYVKYFKLAVRRTDFKFISFLIITFWFSQSESILELNKGIIFFSLFFTLLSARYLPDRNLPHPSPRPS